MELKLKPKPNFFSNKWMIFFALVCWPAFFTLVVHHPDLSLRYKKNISYIILIVFLLCLPNWLTFLLDCENNINNKNYIEFKK